MINKAEEEVIEIWLPWSVPFFWSNFQMQVSPKSQNAVKSILACRCYGE